MTRQHGKDRAWGATIAPPSLPTRPRWGDFELFRLDRGPESWPALAGLVVVVFDKDVVQDDVIGEPVTDAHGRFELRFTTDSFGGVYETHPDLYLRVFDASKAQQLLSTRDAVRWNAGNDEQFDLVVHAPRSQP